MFTYPVMSGGGGITQEYLLAGLSNTMQYIAIDGVAGTANTLATLAFPNVSAKSIAADARHVLLPSNTAHFVAQFKWNGSAFVSVNDSDGGAPNTFSQGMFITPYHPNRFIVPAVEAFARELSAFSYQSAAPYSYADAGNNAMSGVTNPGVIMAFRRADPGVATEGDDFVLISDKTSSVSSAFTYNGTTITPGNQVSFNAAHAGTSKHGYDRDSGRIVVASNTASTVAAVWQYNLTPRTFTSVGNATFTNNIYS